MITNDSKEITNRDLMDFMGKMAEDISSIKVSISNIETSISSLDIRVSKLESEVANLKSEITNIKDEVKELRAEIKDVRSVLYSLSERSDEDNRATARSVMRLEKRVTKIETQLKSA